MTDVLAALSVLCGIECPQRMPALARFYQAWHEEDLVLDKWFAIQAMSNLGTPEAMRALSEHKDFDLRNPNRVRAWSAASCRQSGALPRRVRRGVSVPRRYHHRTRSTQPAGGGADGGAARQWRRVDSERQGLMQGELRRILEASELSRNTFEMVSKSLAP